MKKIIILLAVLFAFSNAMAQDCTLNDDARRHWFKAEGMRKAIDNVNDWQLVADEYEKALQYEPNCPVIYYNLGICYEELGRVKPASCDKAITYYRKYIQLSPNAENRSEVEGLIYEVEGKKEMYQRQIQKRLAEERLLKEEQENERIRSQFSGTWRQKGSGYYDGKIAEWMGDMGILTISGNYENMKIYHHDLNKSYYGKLRNRRISFEGGEYCVLVSDNEINHFSSNGKAKRIYVRE